MPALSVVITDCRNELIDTGGTPRWTDAEFLSWANAFFRELASLAPDYVSARVTLSLAAGAYQSLPAQYTDLIELISNAAGESIREVSYAALKASISWGNTDADADGPKEYARVSSGEFAVYPAAPSGGATVTALVIEAPTIAAVGDSVPGTPDLLPALYQYMIYRARSKDAEDTVMMARGQESYQKFRQLIGGASGSPAA